MKKSKKVTINNREWFAVSMTVGELITAMNQNPKKILDYIISDAGANFDLAIIADEDISPELRVILDDAGVLEDKEDPKEGNYEG